MMTAILKQCFILGLKQDNLGSLLQFGGESSSFYFIGALLGYYQRKLKCFDNK